MQSFTVNNLNQLSNATRSGTLTVAGATTTNASSVTVNTLTADRYADNTFARAGFTLSNGTNTFTAIATDSLGRGDTNTLNSYLPSTLNFVYDLNGNLRTNGTRVLEYDDENQLTRVTEPSAWKAEFTYDGKMRMRISKDYAWRNGAWVLTNEVHRIYNGMLVLQERDQFNVPKLTYTRGKDLSGSLEGAGGIGGLLALSDHKSQILDHLYFHADGNGNVTALVDTNQNVVARYLYDPFGNTLSATGPKADANKYRFSSKEAQSQSGLVYYGYRFYEPSLQRWPNKDPFADYGFQELSSANAVQRTDEGLYVFVDNSPLGKIDNWGLEPSIKGCQQKQVAAIKKALKDDCDKAKKCAPKCQSSGQAAAGVASVCDKNPTIICVDSDFTFGDGNVFCKEGDRGCARTRGNEIFLCPAAFRPGQCGGKPGCSLFHEGLHMGGLKHGSPEPPDFDQMKNCLGCK